MDGPRDSESMADPNWATSLSTSGYYGSEKAVYRYYYIKSIIIHGDHC